MASPASVLFNVELVDLHLQSGSGEAAIQQLCDRLEHTGHLADARSFCKLVLARESISSTALGSGVAFPHARTENVSALVVAMGRSEAGIPFQENQPPVKLLFVIGTPPTLIHEYLNLVGRLARLLRNESVRARLLAAASAEEFVGVLTESA
jgi:mannitol/fructose-specific phosphotransferase system IIA component (Ntr-type)